MFLFIYLYFYILKKGCKNTIFLLPDAFFVFLQRFSIMFYYLNKNGIAQFVVIALLMAWAIYTVLTQMVICSAEGQSVLFSKLALFWTNHPLNLKVTVIVMLLLETFLLSHYYSLNRFSDTQTFIPAVFFLLMMNLGGFLKVITPASITLMFLTLILLVNAQDENERPVKNRVFTSGLLVGICSLFDPISLCVILFLLLALITHRYSKTKEIIILFSGVLFVLAYLISVCFFTDSFPVLADSIKHLAYFGVIKDFMKLSIYNYIFLAYTVQVVVYLMIQLKLFYDNKLIVLRKRLVTIHFLTFVSVGMLFLSGLKLSSGFLYMMIPITMYFSMITLYKNRIILHDILIVAFYVLLWL